MSPTTEQSSQENSCLATYRLLAHTAAVYSEWEGGRCGFCTRTLAPPGHTSTHEHTNTHKYRLLQLINFFFEIKTSIDVAKKELCHCEVFLRQCHRLTVILGFVRRSLQPSESVCRNCTSCKKHILEY